jgi:hypothetical protein
MPIITGKGAGSQEVAVASVNRVFATGVVEDAATVNTDPLMTPGMTRLTWYVQQTAGTAPFLVTPQVALRHSGANQTFVWLAVAAPTLTAPGGTPFVFTLNTVACEAMRLVLVSQAPAGVPADPLQATGFLSASA